MAIFSRRSLQRLITENSSFLLQKQTKKHVAALNRMYKELSLAVEWEVVLLNAFSKAGKVLHENDVSGTADIYFEAHQQSDQAFVADITTVSDKGLDEISPVEALDHELAKIVNGRSLNPNPSTFMWEIITHLMVKSVLR
jgi:uncharacterized protein (DUF885 family)